MKDALRKFSLSLIAVTVTVISSVAQQTQEVEMADVLRRDGKIYTVVIGLVVVVTGLVIFLVRVDRRVERLGKK